MGTAYDSETCLNNVLIVPEINGMNALIINLPTRTKHEPIINTLNTQPGLIENNAASALMSNLPYRWPWLLPSLIWTAVSNHRSQQNGTRIAHSWPQVGGPYTQRSKIYAFSYRRNILYPKRRTVYVQRT